MWVVLLHDEAEDDSTVVYAVKGPFDNLEEAHRYAKGQWGHEVMEVTQP